MKKSEALKRAEAAIKTSPWKKARYASPKQAEIANGTIEMERANNWSTE